MRYMGSKAKYAKHIIPILMDEHDESKPYVEPFLGGGNMFSEVSAPIKWGNDVSFWAVELLSSLSAGWMPPTNLSETEYYQIKEDPYGYEPALVGFAAYCCSYAGKEWGGYARGNDAKGSPRNFAAEQVRNLERQRNGLIGARFTNLSYLEMGIEPESTVYCDPPYAGTTSYKSDFDHSVFWDWCNDLVDKRCRVFVSEYNAPTNWIPVWEKEVTNSLTKNTGAKKGTEKLFTSERIEAA